MSNSFTGYKSVVVESFFGRDKSSRHGPVHIRPVAEEGFPEGIRVECSKKMTNTSVYPLGTKFVISAKMKSGTHLYSYYGDPVVVKNELPPVSKKKRAKEWSGIFPNEISSTDDFHEGSAKQVLVNKFERDVSARKKCIKHYGPVCVICDFDFKLTYGELGSGFIHVHHLISLASIGEEYVVDPLADLRPVCPNCHAMLHRKNPPFEIDEIRKLLSAT